MLPANFIALFYEPELLSVKVLHSGNTDFGQFCSCDLELDQMTFIYELGPYPLEIYRMRGNELHLLSSDIHTDRQTPPKLYTTPLRGWSLNKHLLTPFKHTLILIAS